MIHPPCALCIQEWKTKLLCCFASGTKWLAIVKRHLFFSLDISPKLCKFQGISPAILYFFQFLVGKEEHNTKHKEEHIQAYNERVTLGAFRRAPTVNPPATVFQRHSDLTQSSDQARSSEGDYTASKSFEVPLKMLEASLETEAK